MIRKLAARRHDLAALAIFRILFGALMCFGALRFIANGWVETTFVKPGYFFHYYGFEWVDVLPPWAMLAAFWVLAGLALCVALGLFYRVAIVGFFLLFTYVELIDVTNYLNHYYLVSVMSLLMAFMPLNGMWSLDARRKPALRRQTLPAWMTWLLRFQVGLVYVYAGVAKLTSDWLVHGQPLDIWLSARTDVPLIGAFVGEPWAATVFSWAGCLHDLLIVPLLLWRPTRAWAYGVLVAFHVVTGMLFNIGLFPAIMIVCATVFFAPDWVRRFGWFSAAEAERLVAVARERRWPRWVRSAGFGAVALFCVLQLVWPLRTFAYGGNVHWHEQGMRFSWRVMVREKNGAVTYRIRTAERPHRQLVYPRRYLTPFQEREMAGQPDLILQLAQHIAAEARSDGHTGVEVRVDAWASLNGRPAARLIDPDVDLASVRDGHAAADWILPGPTKEATR